MGHYAIALKYNFEPNNPEGEITEYFLPFSVEELSNLELYEFTKNALRKMRHTELYPLDSFVKRNVLEETENIVWLEDNEIRENEAMGLLGSDNCGEEFLAFSLWNLLSEANMVFYASQNLEDLEIVNRLATKTIYSQHELLALKLQISLLLHFENEKQSATPRFMYERNENGGRIENLYDMLSFYEITSQASEYNPITLNLIEQWMHMEEESDPAFYEVRNIIGEICELIQINNDSEVESVQRRSNWRYINSLSDELLKELWKPFDTAYYYHKTINAVLENSESVRRPRDYYSFRKFIDEISGISRPVLSTRSRLTDGFSGFQEHSNAICSVRFSYLDYWNSYSDYFGGLGAESKILKRYSGSGYGCFALLFTDTGKHYFAISGMLEELKPMAGKLATPVKYIMEHILNKVPVSNILDQNYTFNFAYMRRDLEVRRYTEIVKDNTDYIGKPGPYLLKGYETYSTDYSLKPWENYSSTYSCCERKMLAYSDYQHAVKIYSRWAPCWKCCPAILYAPKVEVYAFATLDEFVQNGRVAGVELKRYKVQLDQSYSVTEI